MGAGSLHEVTQPLLLPSVLALLHASRESGTKKTLPVLYHFSCLCEESFSLRDSISAAKQPLDLQITWKSAAHTQKFWAKTHDGTLQSPL